MGGKNYICDYCICYMKNDINVRKIHNSGLAHTIAKANYLRRIEDPRRVLAIETAKVPCTRYQKGYCKFELFCQYSHYSHAHLEELRKICLKIERHDRKKTLKCDKKATKILLQLLPWSANNGKQKLNHKRVKHLPPSIKAFNFRDIINKTSSEWGNK